MSINNSLVVYLVGALIFSLIVATAIKYVPRFHMDNEKMYKVAILAGIVYLCIALIINKINNNSRSRAEGMVSSVNLDFNVTPFPMYENTYGEYKGYDENGYPALRKYPEVERPEYPLLNTPAPPSVSRLMPEAEIPEAEINMSHPESVEQEQPHPNQLQNISTMINNNNNTGCPCETPRSIPTQFSLDRLDGDVANTGLIYNNDNPRNPLIKSGQFENSMFIPFSTVRKVVDKQRYNYDDFMMSNTYPKSLYINYPKAGIPYDDAEKVICKSKMWDLYYQHNHNIESSPHSHYGKSRGYLNWEKTN
jgi:hypothetical protein